VLTRRARPAALSRTAQICASPAGGAFGTGGAPTHSLLDSQLNNFALHMHDIVACVTRFAAICAALACFRVQLSGFAELITDPDRVDAVPTGAARAAVPDDTTELPASGNGRSLQGGLEAARTANWRMSRPKVQNAEIMGGEAEYEGQAWLGVTRPAGG
jgi:hypothetical protein